MINPDWKDGELGYCLQLVADGGNNEVGGIGNQISYLRLQAESAMHDQERDNATILRALADNLETTMYRRA